MAGSNMEEVTFDSSVLPDQSGDWAGFLSFLKQQRLLCLLYRRYTCNCKVYIL